MSFMQAFAEADHPGLPPSPMIERPAHCLHLGHKRFVFRDTAARTSPRRYGFQCLECGAFPNIPFRPAWVGEKRCLSVHGKQAAEAVSSEDRLTGDITARRNAHWSAWRQASIVAKRGWWDWYNAYLRSFAWAVKRGEALKRDAYQCQNCFAPAEEVHHLTYENVGREPLSDLVSLCKSCHDGIHGWDE